MSPGGSEESQRERLLSNMSLETCPPELRQSLAYVLHLRSYWKPKGRAKLIVPASWMGLLGFADAKRGTECVADQGCCPFGNVRFDSARLVIPDEELPQDVIPWFQTNVEINPDCLAALIPRTFNGIPHTRSSSDVPAMGLAAPQSTSRCIDFALVLGHDVSAEDNARCLLLGMKEPTRMQHPSSESFNSRFAPPSIPEELTSHAQFNLTLLASLTRGGATTEYFPEWLVLFGLIYDAHQVCIVAYVPRRCESNVMVCAAYITDQISFRPDGVATGKPTCGLILERLRLLLALTALRRHVLHLSKLLFTPVGLQCDGVGRTVGFTCDQHSSESLKQCGSPVSNSEYSTCPSSVHSRELNDVFVGKYGGFSSSCGSSASSFCSTCPSLLKSTSTTGTSSSGDAKDTDSNSSNHMGPSLSHGSNGGVTWLTETKTREIIAWAREVIPTEHPVKDTYKMVIYRDPHPGRHRVAGFKSNKRY